MPARENLKAVLKESYPHEVESIAKKKLIDERIIAFLRNLRKPARYHEGPSTSIPNLRGEEEGDIESHPFLLPYYRLVLEMTRDYGGGLYLVDPKGIYLPIEEGLFGICHLIRIPRRKKNVYALTDFRNCAMYQDSPKNPRLTVIFQGVRETLFSGYKFMADIFYIMPISAVSPVMEMEYSYEVIEDKDMVEAEEIGDTRGGLTDMDEDDESDEDWREPQRG